MVKKAKKYKKISFSTLLKRAIFYKPSSKILLTSKK